MFQQTVVFPIGTKYAPYWAIFVKSFETTMRFEHKLLVYANQGAKFDRFFFYNNEVNDSRSVDIFFNFFYWIPYGIIGNHIAFNIEKTPYNTMAINVLTLKHRYTGDLKKN